MSSYDIGRVLRMANFCGDCGRNFDDCGGEYVVIRLRPARLICQDCKLKEPGTNEPIDIPSDNLR